MLRPAHLSSLLLASAVLFACDSSGDETPDASVDTRDAGPSDRAPDAAPPADAGSPGADVGGPDAQADLGVIPADSGFDASLDAGEDAGEDASIDAGQDAGPALNRLYASFGETLVRIDPDTLQLTEIGRLRNAANETEAYSLVAMAYDPALEAVYLLTTYIAPQLGTVDLCTGLVTLGPTLSRASSPNLVVEGLAVHPNGTVYVSSGNPPNPQNAPLSSHLGTLDLGSGFITDVGAAASTLQNDVDQLFFQGATLYGTDIVSDMNRLDLFTFDLGTGVSTRVVAPTYSPSLPLRIAHDDSRGKTFAWRLADRNLLEIDLTDGEVTALGATHTSTSFGNAPSRGFFFAPEPGCPD